MVSEKMTVRESLAALGWFYRSLMNWKTVALMIPLCAVTAVRTFHSRSPAPVYSTCLTLALLNLILICTVVFMTIKNTDRTNRSVTKTN